MEERKGRRNAALWVLVLTFRGVRWEGQQEETGDRDEEEEMEEEEEELLQEGEEGNI